MNNVTGKAVVSEDYLKSRLYLVDELRDLVRKTSVVIEAPRRFGKTSVIKEFKRQEDTKSEEKREFNVIFLELEGEETLHAFCFKLFKELLSLYHIRRKYDMITDLLGTAWNAIASRIKKLQMPEFEVELREKTRDMDFTAWKEKLTPLITGLNSFDMHTVIAFDEFPDMLLNFKNRANEHEDYITLVDRLTAWLRTLRQNQTDCSKYQFVFCGSVNMRNTLDEIGLGKRMNDVESLLVPNMTEEDAKLLIDSLTKKYALEIMPEGVSFMTSKITNGSPYYGQILFKALLDSRERKISLETLKTLYEQMLRGGNHDLNHFHARLKTYLGHTKRECSEIILKYLCIESLPEKYLFDHHISGVCGYEDFQSVINRLLYEGYIMRDTTNNGSLTFVAPLLKDWWSYKAGVR
ncbi:MAG: ATPase domain protein, prokaryote domain protein [Candidatus Brocadiaceae bacterium]|nr:ATPase domain protein, prokaryote domain protein [Candidatus Brocadiaceae bacterium]